MFLSELHVYRGRSGGQPRLQMSPFCKSPDRLQVLPKLAFHHAVCVTHAKCLQADSQVCTARREAAAAAAAKAAAEGKAAEAMAQAASATAKAVREGLQAGVVAHYSGLSPSSPFLGAKADEAMATARQATATLEVQTATMQRPGPRHKEGVGTGCKGEDGSCVGCVDRESGPASRLVCGRIV